MSRHRHSNENRVPPGESQLREFVDVLRHRATRRLLTLLECAVIRHAPFADCGRTIWELLPSQKWFHTTEFSAAYIRAIDRAIQDGLSIVGGDLTLPDPGPMPPIDGHQAIERLERYADAVATDDELFIAERYFRHAEYSAEGHCFDMSEEQRDELELSYLVGHWLRGLCGFGPKSWNVIDYYVVNYPGEFYVWAGWRPLHHEHRTVALALIEDILGNPNQRLVFAPRWRTSTAVAIAQGMYESRDFSAMPILADALQDAGCENTDVLDHCRSQRLHIRGCWVVDRVLGKE